MHLTNESYSCFAYLISSSTSELDWLLPASSHHGLEGFVVVQGNGCQQQNVFRSASKTSSPSWEVFEHDMHQFGVSQSKGTEVVFLVI
jgi:hypothetical protein